LTIINFDKIILDKCYIRILILEIQYLWGRRRFMDKVVLITGGSSGIGKAIAKSFLTEGAKVMISGRSDARCSKAVGELKDIGKGEIDYIQGDVSKPSDAEKMVHETVEKYGRIDILVNNAGIYLEKRAEETTEEEWDQVIDINLKGVFLCSKAVYPHFRKQGGGNIVNVSSDSGIFGNPSEAAYCASKGGVTNLTRAMALDYAKENIRVNAVCPAVIDTPMLQREVMLQENPDEYLAEIAQLHPVGRIGKDVEVAFAVLMLSSDEAAFITGVNLPVDGGLTSI